MKLSALTVIFAFAVPVVALASPQFYQDEKIAIAVLPQVSCFLKIDDNSIPCVGNLAYMHFPNNHGLYIVPISLEKVIIFGTINDVNGKTMTLDHVGSGIMADKTPKLYTVEASGSCNADVRSDGSTRVECAAISGTPTTVLSPGEEHPAVAKHKVTLVYEGR